jgi:hypothetical protein
MSKRIRRGFLAVMMVVGACSGSGTGTPRTVREFEGVFEDLNCRTRFGCCAQAATAKWGTEAACVAQMEAQLASKVANVEADIANGDARYDAVAAQKFLDLGNMLASNCAQNVDVQMFLSELTAVVIGQRAAGAACDDNHAQCAPGTECVSHVCTAQPAPPVPQPDGSACTSDAECKSSRCDQAAHTCNAVTVSSLMCSF